MAEVVLSVLDAIPPFEKDKPVFVLAGKTLTLSQVKEEILKGSTLGIELSEKIGMIVGGKSSMDVLSEDDLCLLAIERYKWYVTNVSDYEAVRIHILGTGSFSIADVINILENKKDGYKQFVEAEAKYLDWLFRR